jgi:hypothetical protein
MEELIGAVLAQAIYSLMEKAIKQLLEWLFPVPAAAVTAL